MFLLCALILSFDIGPTVGALVPVQDEGDPWKTSFSFGLEARYGLSAFDLESEIMFTELGIDPDSSKGYTYSMVPLSVGVGKEMGFLRYGIGPALYPIEANKEIVEGLEAVWQGTFPGMYVSIGKDLPVGSNIIDLKTKFNIIDTSGLWIGITASYLF
ncbi:MAG: hypothetical protein GF388_07010 [Candidatus Aegiribacteria sp.]|nr:hypothetical protein [Candidatus Aegiribacteria sp.]MBD3294882.1 hypothetical protein [Candidatus Fermentibacteria bacterium]